MMPDLRFARDQDSAGIIALIDACYSEYPPNVLDVDLEEPELRAPASSFEAFWVLENAEQRIVGCIALATVEAGKRIELKKCYVAQELRGTGQGRRLIETVEAWARERGIPEVELWSDSRMTLAHKVYAKLGYVPSGRTRDLHDISETTELYFVKHLAL